MADRIPVLLMVRELGIGGSERQLAILACSLDRKIFKTHVGCFLDEGLRRRELDEAGVPIVRLPVPNVRSPKVIPSAWRLRHYIRSQGIRLVHAFDYPTILFAIPAVRALTTSVAISSQRSDRQLMSPKLRRGIRITDAMAHGIVVNSRDLVRHMTKEEGVPTEKIEVCANAIDVNALSEQAGADGLRRTEFAGATVVFGVICALRPEKDLPTLLKAFSRISDGAARLVIVGDGPCAEEWKALAQSLRLGDRCRFVSATANVAPWLHAMDVFVLPSTTEGLSNALMEAMACGCCVVASTAGGNPELVQDGENGLLFNAGDVAGLAERLIQVARDEALRKELGHRAKRSINESFSVEAAAGRMSEIYMRFLAAPKSGANV